MITSPNRQLCSTGNENTPINTTPPTLSTGHPSTPPSTNSPAHYNAVLRSTPRDILAAASNNSNGNNKTTTSVPSATNPKPPHTFYSALTHNPHNNGNATYATFDNSFNGSILNRQSSHPSSSVSQHGAITPHLHNIHLPTRALFNTLLAGTHSSTVRLAFHGANISIDTFN